MQGQPASGDVASALLAYLRGALAVPALSYREPPERMTGGFDTTVYAFTLRDAPPPFDERLVVRIFPAADSPARAGFEAAIQNAISAQGYPAPPALLQCAEATPLGSPFLVMPRAPGRRLLDTLLGPSFYRVPATLADVHMQLHALDPWRIRESLRQAGIPALGSGPDAWLAGLRDELQADGLSEFEPALAWLDSHVPRTTREPVLCHLDFHPMNVLADGGKVTGVIDWANASFGDPAADVAVTRVLMTLGPLDAFPLLGWLLDLFRRAVTWQYTRAYLRRRPIPRADIRYYEALRCCAAMLHVARRQRQASTAAQGYAWGAPGTIRRLTRHFRRITGVQLPAGLASP